MFYCRVLFLVYVALFCAADQFEDDCGLEAIALTPLVREGLGGVKAKQFPWHVAIFHRDENNQFKQACGGSLVRSNLVISAAHCFSDRAHNHQVHVADYRVVAGVRLSSWNSTEIGRQQSEVREVNLGEEYGASTRNFEDDISVIQLTTKFTFSDTVRAVCLDLTDTDLYTRQTSPGSVGKVAGWGLTESGVHSDSLNFLGVPVVARGECLDKLPFGFKAHFTSDKICAGFTNGTSVCQGDSGGGLVFPLQSSSAGPPRWFLRGVLSNAPSSHNLDPCPGNVFAFYTNIYRHRLWLTTQTDDNLPRDCGLEAIASTPLVRAGLGVKANQFPWHVAIFHRKEDNQFEQLCGGSLVRSNVVISVAHCFSARAYSHQVRVADYRIVAGVRSSSWNSTDIGRQQSEIREVRLGENYGGSYLNFEDDISIIYLTTRFTFSDTVRPVCLDLTDTDLYTNQTSPGSVGKVAGWGLTESGDRSDVLNFLEVPVVAREECIDKLPYGFKSYLTSDKLCAGFTNGTAVCQGDAGGGLVFPLQNSNTGPQRWFLRGVLSNAPASSNQSDPCAGNVFALYTNIYRHRMWLSTQMDDNLPRG